MHFPCRADGGLVLSFLLLLVKNAELGWSLLLCVLGAFAPFVSFWENLLHYLCSQCKMRTQDFLFKSYFDFPTSHRRTLNQESGLVRMRGLRARSQPSLGVRFFARRLGLKGHLKVDWNPKWRSAISSTFRGELEGTDVGMLHCTNKNCEKNLVEAFSLQQYFSGSCSFLKQLLVPGPIKRHLALATGYTGTPSGRIPVTVLTWAVLHTAQPCAGYHR